MVSRKIRKLILHDLGDRVRQAIPPFQPHS
jgi:hypothetical protein